MATNSTYQLRRQLPADVDSSSSVDQYRVFLNDTNGLLCMKDFLGVVTVIGGAGQIVFIHRAPLTGPAVQLALLGESVKADPTGGVVTVNLPSAAGATGFQIKVISLADMIGPPAIDIVPFGAETINGDLTKSLTTPRERMTLESDGASWLVVD
jgi:hypothetical protein